MNELFDRIMEMPLRQRVLLLTGGVFLCFFAYASGLYLPRHEEIQTRADNLDALRKDRDRKVALVANLPRARQAVAVLKAALKEAVAQLPDTKEIPDLLNAISAAARESGLEIRQFRQEPETYQEFYAAVPVEILVRGSYWQVEAFFQRVSELTRIVNVGDIGIKAPALIENDPVLLQTSCAATTFRFLDEAERQRIATARDEKGGNR
jgi:type IV pilus assembly protein PilO